VKMQSYIIKVGGTYSYLCSLKALYDRLNFLLDSLNGQNGTAFSAERILLPALEFLGVNLKPLSALKVCRV